MKKILLLIPVLVIASVLVVALQQSNAITNTNSNYRVSSTAIATFSAQTYNQTSLFFNGNNTHISITDADQYIFNVTKSATISMWFNHTGWCPNAIGGNNPTSMCGLAGQGNTVSQLGWDLTEDGDQITMCLRNGTTATFCPTSSAVTLLNGTWYHLVVTINSSTIRYYINGTLLSSHNGFGNYSYADGFNLTIGMRNQPFDTSNNHIFNGTIDEFRFYNTTLNATQVSDIYTSGLKPNSSLNSSNLIAWYSFNENFDSVAYDKSPYHTNSTGFSNYPTYINDGNLITLQNLVDYTLDNTNALFTLTNSIYNYQLLLFSYETVYACTSGDRSVLNLIIIAGSLMVLLPFFFIFAKSGFDWEEVIENITVKSLIVTFIIIVTGVVFLITSAQNISTVCG